MLESQALTAAVVIITYRRPHFVRTCLEHLAALTRAPEETYVIDASPDGLTRDVVADFPTVRYLHSDAGPGTMATSRAMALAATTCDVLVFLDDDANADPDWLKQLLLPYADPTVAAVGGRARNGQPGEETEGLDQIGLLTADGKLLGFFAADPGHDVDVDHLLGANMSVRREVLLALGGIRDNYPGTCLREESDMFLRVRQAGHRIVYTPSAVVTHVAAPYVHGRRFDLRYHYYGHRNHIV
ncbi:MAG TPA: glycosyltransferase family 2 protein, partial [Dermatophilaceae bacterium]|nr:glycosyltransferase family 2 protein [Dermatophilaceae bacterium]